MRVTTKGTLANKLVSAVLAFSLCCMGMSANAIQEAFAEETVDDQLTALADDEEEVLNQSVVANISADENDSGEAITEALTGEQLGVTFYAYNDNPNATAVAKMRLYVDQVTALGNVTQINPEGLDPENLDQSVILCELSQGGEATKVEAKWNLLAADDAENTRGYDVYYLEFALPSGASVSFDMSIYTTTGYDSLITSQLYCDYMVADNEGTYPTEWSRLKSQTNDNEADASEDGVLELNWTGKWEWSSFAKFSDATSLGYEDNHWAVNSNNIAYSFSATNAMYGKDLGVVYTESATLTDTLTLPEGISLPVGATADLDRGTVYAADGTTAIYVVRCGKSYQTLKSLSIVDSHTISYTVEMTNPDVANSRWLPLSEVYPTLYTKDLVVTEGKGTISNEAAFTVYSVKYGDGQAVDTVSTFSKGDARAVYVNSDGELNLVKVITKVRDNYGKDSTEKNDAGLPVIKNGYQVDYLIQINNSSSFAREVELTDVIPVALDALISDTSSSTLRVTDAWGNVITSYKYTYNQTSDTEKTLTVKTTVPAKANYYITYTCKVDTTKIATAETATVLTNTAKVGDKESKVSVTTPEPGAFTYSKELVSRYTTSTTGTFLYIWKNEQGQVAYTGDSNYLQSLLNNSQAGAPSSGTYYSEGTSQYTTLNYLLHQMNAGDALEYLITADNATGAAVRENVVDFHPCVNKVYSNLSGWRYYSLNSDGSASYMGRKSYGYTVDSFSNNASSTNDYGRASGWATAYKCGPNKDQSSGYKNQYSYHDLNDLIAPEVSLSYGPLVWNVTSGSGMAPYATYKQTTVFLVPGDNTLASSDFDKSLSSRTGSGSTTGNYDFQTLVSMYQMGYYSNPSGRQVPYSYLQIGNRTATEEVSYSVAPQRSITTGVLATGTLADRSTISNGDLKSVYTTDLTQYETSSSSYVVNYVYIFNDSDQTMDLSKMTLQLSIPSNFTFLGFVRPYQYASGSVGITYTSPVSSISESDYYSSYVSYGPTAESAVAAANLRSNQPYVAKGTNEQQVDDKKYGNMSVSFSYTGTSRMVSNGYANVPSITASGTLNAYTGCVLMYACQGSDVASNANSAYYYGGYLCGFGATITALYGYSPQADPCIYTSELFAAPCRANMRGSYGGRNSGICNSYLDGYINYYSSHKVITENSQGNDLYYPNRASYAGRAASLPRDGANPTTSLWSIVNLHTTKTRMKVSVDKQVVSNSGFDSQTTPPERYAAGEAGVNYDDYYWNYILHDGLHRTVDGTVTWKTTVANSAKKSYEPGSGGDTGNTDYKNTLINCSTLVETVDSPYVLREIYIPYLQFVPVMNGEISTDYGQAVYTTENLYIELPGDNDSQWTRMSDGALVYQASLNTLATQSGGNSNFPSQYVRITKRTIEGGSLGWGYDVDSPDGDRNTSATQYIIEFSSNNTTWRLPGSWSVVLPTQDKATGSIRSSLDFYFTFETNDSIETNYNSFALYTAENNGNVVDVTQGVLRAGAASHTKNATQYGLPETAADDTLTTTSADDELSELAVLPALPQEGKSGVYFPDGTNAYNGKSAGNISTGYVVEHSDWTDTSYTDGVKTITLLDEEGNATDTTINTRANGDMKLPEKAHVGDSIHVQLSQENVLNESENYTSYDGLQVYDVWGVEEGYEGALNNAYDVDFDSIKVTYATGSTKDHGDLTELVLGTDYEVYYTTTNLVVYEHHPIQPLNTLTYAADLGKLEGSDTEWVLYDPQNPPAEDVVVAGIKVKLKSDSAYYQRLNQKLATVNPDLNNVSDTLFVDFDTTVSERAANGGTYPNIEAWSATIHVKDSEEVKPIIQDTTALFIDVEKEAELLLTKKLVDGTWNAVESDEEFTFFIIGSDRYEFPSYRISKITDIATVTLKAGQTVNLEDIDLIYQETEGSSLLKKCISIVEVEKKGVKYNSCDGAFWLNLGYDFSEDMVKAIAGVDADFAKAISDNDNQLKRYVGYLDVSSPARVTLKAQNKVDPTILALGKIDKDGNTINDEVSFTLKDSEGNLVMLGKDADGYFYTTDEEKATESVITFNGTIEVRDLPYDTYTLTETVAPSGYVAGEPVEVEVGFGTTEVSVVNQEDGNAVVAPIHVTKVDSETKEAITGSNATFQVYASNDEGAEPLHFVATTEGGTAVAGSYGYAEDLVGVETVTSVDTSEGTLDLNLMPEGEYYLVETDAPAGYALAGNTLETATKVTVKRGETENITVAIENEFVSADLTIVKIDSQTEEPITGNSIFATFELKLQDEEGKMLTFSKKSEGVYAYDAEGGEADLQTSSRTGKLMLTGLPKGTYTLAEVIAPKGYAIDQAETTIEVADNTPQEVKISDTVTPITLRVVKSWVLEGGNRYYPLADVPFTLYQIQADEETGARTKATEYKTGVTASDGVMSVKEVDWTQDYLLVETLPEGYSTSGATTVYVNDETGEIDLTQREAAEGFTAVEAIPVFLSSNQSNLTADNQGVWTFTSDVLNVKNVTYGGLYASISYKTIDNADASEKYGADLLPYEKGYSYFYTEDDYEAGNYNYVHVVQADDLVTYTLNVVNVSDYPFKDIALIDRLPEQEDTGVVNLDENRDSEFTVYNPSAISVAVDGKVLDQSSYQVSYSEKIQFTNGDFNNSTEWDQEASEGTKSLRIAFTDDFELLPGQQITVTFDAVVGSDASVGSIAWNNFAYRYTAGGDDSGLIFASVDEDVLVTESTVADADDADDSLDALSTVHRATLTPEPPKVGVMIVEFESTIEGSKTFEAVGNQDEATSDFEFQLSFVSAENDATIDNISYVNADGDTVAFPAEGLTAALSDVANDGQAVDFAFDKLVMDRFDVYTFQVTEVIPEGAVDNGDGTYSVGPITYNQVVYTVTVDCTKAISQDEVCVVEPEYEADGQQADAAAFVNDYDNKTAVEGSKTWVDNDDEGGYRPSEITVGLYKNGKLADVAPVAADPEGNWLFIFDDLAKYDQNGNEYEYTVAEINVPEGYTAAVDGTEIVNTAIERITISGSKIWEDEDDADGLRPSSITVNLLRNGEVVASVPVKADKDGNWTYSFDEQLKYDQEGNEYVYTVAEAQVPEGYTATVKGTDIVNTHTPDKPDTPDKPTKPDVPSTGDTMGVLVAGLVAVTVLAAAVMLFIRRRQNQ